jgi:hypothetical protein
VAPSRLPTPAIIAPGKRLRVEDASPNERYQKRHYGTANRNRSEAPAAACSNDTTILRHNDISCEASATNVDLSSLAPSSTHQTRELRSVVHADSDDSSNTSDDMDETESNSLHNASRHREPETILQTKDRLMCQLREAVGPVDLQSALSRLPPHLTRTRALYETAQTEHEQLRILRYGRSWLFCKSIKYLSKFKYVTLSGA